MSEELNEALENANEANEEMKSSNSLTDILNKKVKYAERTVVSYLDYDSAIRAFELQEEINMLTNDINTPKSQTYRSITDDSGQEQIDERDKLVQELADLNDTIQESRAEWLVRGIPPKVWKVIDSSARRKFPLAKEADDNTKLEVQLKRNDWVNQETTRQGIIKVTFADGTEITDITVEDMQMIFDEIPVEVTMSIKEKIDELTYANRTFHEDIESADFLSNS